MENPWRKLHIPNATYVLPEDRAALEEGNRKKRARPQSDDSSDKTFYILFHRVGTFVSVPCIRDSELLAPLVKSVLPANLLTSARQRSLF